MSLKNLVAGDYGQPLELTFLDVDTSLAANISGYATSKKMIFTQPDGTEVEKTASFKTDGSDGILTYTIEAGFLTAGSWHVKGQVTSASAQLTTERHSFRVL